jgi:hypothetical protein
VIDAKVLSMQWGERKDILWTLEKYHFGSHLVQNLAGSKFREWLKWTQSSEICLLDVILCLDYVTEGPQNRKYLMVMHWNYAGYTQLIAQQYLNLPWLLVVFHRTQITVWLKHNLSG